MCNRYFSCSPVPCLFPPCSPVLLFPPVPVIYKPKGLFLFYGLPLAPCSPVLPRSTPVPLIYKPKGPSLIYGLLCAGGSVSWAFESRFLCAGESGIQCAGESLSCAPVSPLPYGGYGWSHTIAHTMQVGTRSRKLDGVNCQTCKTTLHFSHSHQLVSLWASQK